MKHKCRFSCVFFGLFGCVWFQPSQFTLLTSFYLSKWSEWNRVDPSSCGFVNWSFDKMVPHLKMFGLHAAIYLYYSKRDEHWTCSGWLLDGSGCLPLILITLVKWLNFLTVLYGPNTCKCYKSYCMFDSENCIYILCLLPFDNDDRDWFFSIFLIGYL